MASDNVNLVQVVLDRGALSTSEDVAVITMHWRGANPAAPDSWAPMDTTRWTNAENKITTFLNNIKANITPKITLREFRWYKATVRGESPGPAVRVQPGVLLFTAGGSPLPPQVACSITFRTDKRKNWGRFYMPGIDSSKIGSTGRWLAALQDSFCTNAAVMTSRALGVTETLTVWSPTEGTHHDPQQVEVDDIPDVIRSRRFSYPLYKKIVSAG